ncbi:MAG: TetR/AcrR family transcriptional regulator [Deltaproteobacteria bacterium]|nr:TetR/AcrR family transcriptional regulator [Deltaproteobacteria bacterium]
MGRPRARPDQQATTERLLAAAELEFGRVGFAAARLQDIGKRAGISRPSLLYHFKSKDELYAAVVHGAFARMGAAIAESTDLDAALPERIDALVNGYLRFIHANPAVARLVLREVVDGKGPGRALMLREAVPVLELIEGFLRRSAKGALRPGVPLRQAVLAVAFSAMVRAAAEELRDPLFGPKDHTPTLARMVLLRS